MANTDKTIGLLGLGLVGKAITPLLRAAGCDVVGYAPSQASRDAFEALDGIDWLVQADFNVTLAGRTLWGGDEAEMRAGFARLIAVAAPGSQ